MRKINGFLLIAVIVVIIYSLHKSKEIMTILDKKTKDSLLTIAKRAGAIWSLDPLLLLAIGKVESNLNANAVGKPNKNGTIDYGLMQINQINFNFIGADNDTIFDPSINILGGAKILAQKRRYIKDRGLLAQTPELISAYNQGEGNLIIHGITNLVYVSKVLYWYGIYKLRGGL